MSDLARELKKVVAGDVREDASTLDAYSHDASLFEIRPRIVVVPKHTKDIAALVRFVGDKKTHGEDYSLTVRSGGTDMSGGAINDSIILDMTKYFNRLGEVGRNFAVTQPGVYYRDFEARTLAKGLLLPSYPASREICTVGGMVANNSGGEKTLMYGKTENYVEELRAVLADGNEYIFAPLSFAELEEKKKLQTFEGEVYRRVDALIQKNYDRIQRARPRVSKNSAGYYIWNVCDRERHVFDLTKLLVGSQGTLGIITRIRFRLVRPKAHSRLLVIFLKNLDILADVAGRVLAFRPESFESYDDHTFTVAVKFLPEIMRRLRGNAFKLGFQFLPELWAVITGGVPKLVLLAEFTADTPQEAEAQALRAQGSLNSFGLKTHITRSAADAEKYWAIRRESFNLLRHHVRGLRTAPFIDDVIVRPEVLPKFLPHLYALLEKYKLLYTIAGHVGDGNFHIIPLMDLKDPKSKRIITELSEKVYALTMEYGGSITAEHNDGLVRGPYLRAMYGKDMWKVFEEVKHIFDPQGIFNPHKKITATSEYVSQHIVGE